MSNQEKLYEARDIIYATLMAVRPPGDVSARLPSSHEWAGWCLDRSRNAAQALMLLLCPEPSRGPVPTDEEVQREDRIK